MFLNLKRKLWYKKFSKWKRKNVCILIDIRYHWITYCFNFNLLTGDGFKVFVKFHTRWHSNEKNQFSQFQADLKKIKLSERFYHREIYLIKFFFRFAYETHKGRLEIRNGRTYVKFENLKIAAKIRKIRIYLENAFPGPTLNNALNNFINQNTELFLPEVEARIHQTLGKIVSIIIKKLQT